MSVVLLVGVRTQPRHLRSPHSVITRTAHSFSIVFSVNMWAAIYERILSFERVELSAIFRGNLRELLDEVRHSCLLLLIG